MFRLVHSGFDAMALVLLFAVLFMRIHAEYINLADVPCGRSETMRKTKIVGGENAIPHEFPWLVSMTRKGGHWCGGSILNDRFVLTAGHCLCCYTNKIPVKQFKVTLEHNLTDSEVPAERHESIINAVFHPGYRCGKKDYVDDIALLELARPISWSESVKPACLPVATGKPGYSAFGDVNATVAGWGSLEEYKYNKTDVLQKVEVRVLTNTMCDEWLKSQNKKTRVNKTQMCAGLEEGGKDACSHDSGGPLMVESRPGGPLIIIGVVSSSFHGTCARARLPGIYTRVSDYVSWIMQETKSSQ